MPRVSVARYTGGGLVILIRTSSISDLGTGVLRQGALTIDPLCPYFTHWTLLGDDLAREPCFSTRDRMRGHPHFRLTILTASKPAVVLCRYRPRPGYNHSQQLHHTRDTSHM